MMCDELGGSSSWRRRGDFKRLRLLSSRLLFVIVIRRCYDVEARCWRELLPLLLLVLLETLLTRVVRSGRLEESCCGWWAVESRFYSRRACLVEYQLIVFLGAQWEQLFIARFALVEAFDRNTFIMVLFRPLTHCLSQTFIYCNLI